MALLKAAYVSDVPNLDQVPENATTLVALKPTLFSNGCGIVDDIGGNDKCRTTAKKFVVMGHRGSGMNMLQSSDRRMKVIKENSIRSFNASRKFNLDFVEFDVQVTKDDCPVIFHDNFILTEEKGALVEKRVTDLTLDEFLSYGPQRDLKNVDKPLFRKTKDGRIYEWKVEEDDNLCTLQEVFQKVDHSLGFNIELKFDDNKLYREDELTHVLQAVLQVVLQYAKDRNIIFSSFQPDAAQLIRNLQSIYPVFFLTNGGSEIYTDIRRNSLHEAMKLCLAGSLDGIVSEVKAILRNPGAVTEIKNSELSLVTYGQLNNGPQVVYIQYLMGVDGVIVDLVQEITEAVSDLSRLIKEGGENNLFQEVGQMPGENLKCSDHVQFFLLKFIPELMQS